MNRPGDRYDPKTSRVGDVVDICYLVCVDGLRHLDDDLIARATVMQLEKQHLAAVGLLEHKENE